MLYVIIKYIEYKSVDIIPTRFISEAVHSSELLCNLANNNEFSVNSVIDMSWNGGIGLTLLVNIPETNNQDIFVLNHI